MVHCCDQKKNIDEIILPQPEDSIKVEKSILDDRSLPQHHSSVITMLYLRAAPDK